MSTDMMNTNVSPAGGAPPPLPQTQPSSGDGRGFTRTIMRMLAVLLLAVAAFASGWWASRSIAQGSSAVDFSRDSKPSQPARISEPRLEADTLFANSPAQEVLTEMERIQREMDEAFGSAFGRIHSLAGMPHISATSFQQRMNVRDEGDYYKVNVSIPDQDSAKVDVKLEGQLLRVGMSAAQQHEQKTNGMESRQHLVSSFQQAVTLPGPVKPEGMKVDREKGRLIITIPKA